ncbi:hypothetical protein BMETH_278_1 [methanotrophic bacterial endosymbiont of Bathymodiolus sp.]|nr:hypothetical protein BMETH_278_1 [methanotrophic bacterial endosymbiont of Bathymodiolus sp.]
MALACCSRSRFAFRLLTKRLLPCCSISKAPAGVSDYCASLSNVLMTLLFPD